MTNRERFTNFKKIIVKCDKNYCKGWQVLPSETEFIRKCDSVTKYDKRLLQSMKGSAKCENYY